MFKREFLGDNMLSNENVLELRKIFGHPRITTVDDKDKFEVVFADEEENQVLELISNDKAIKYYLVGQLIAYIDIFKHNSGKKSDIFTFIYIILKIFFNTISYFMCNKTIILIFYFFFDFFSFFFF